MQWAPKEESFLNQSAFWPFKVIEVDNFGTNRKHVCDFLLVSHCDYGPILHRFSDTATYWLKLPIFPTPTSFRAPAHYMFPLEFCGIVNHEETRVTGLSVSGEDRMIAA